VGLCKWPDRTASAQPLLLFCTTACDADLAVKSQPAPACRTIESLKLPYSGQAAAGSEEGRQHNPALRVLCPAVLAIEDLRSKLDI
jgi:hypothetical protein